MASSIERVIEMVDSFSNQDGNGIWDRRTRFNEILDERNEAVSDVLFKKIDSPQGYHFLDVGCGGGGTTVRMANSVSSNAHVTGIDISESIVSLAQENMKSIKNVDFILADAETYQFGTIKFDGVISRFGVMFFSDPIRAFTNIHGAMREHAFLTFICWPPRQENAYFYTMTEAVLKHTGKEYRDTGTEPGPLAFSDNAYVESILNSSGFSNVSIETVKTQLSAKMTPEFDAGMHMEYGPSSLLIKDAQPDEIMEKKIYEELLSVCTSHQKGEYVSHDAAINIVSAIA